MAPHLRPLSVQSEYAPISTIARQRLLKGSGLLHIPFSIQEGAHIGTILT
jgi:hypothetical protein